MATPRQPHLGEKIGQLLLIGFRGCQINDVDSIARD
jgi:hypothetical protein